MNTVSPFSLARDIEVSLENVERMNSFTDGYVHKWTIPETTVAEVITGRYEIEHSGHHLFIEPGEMYLVQANTPVSITHHFGNDGRMEAQWARFTAMLFKTTDIISLFDMPLKIDGEAAAKTRVIIDDLYRISLRGQASESSNIPACIADACSISMLLAELTQTIIGISSPKPGAFALFDHADRMGPVLTFIHKHLAQPVHVDDLAGIACMSSSHFHAEFKLALGQSPINYIREIRIREACRLLLHTQKKINEIAEMTGFGNVYYFCRAFKAIRGVSPREYRRANHQM